MIPPQYLTNKKKECEEKERKGRVMLRLKEKGKEVKNSFSEMKLVRFNTNEGCYNPLEPCCFPVPCLNLFAAISSEHQNCLWRLLYNLTDEQKKYVVNIKDTKTNLAPVHLASHYRFLCIIEILVQSGANLNVRDKFGNTPLHLASLNNDNEMMKWIIDHGGEASIWIRNNLGQLSCELIPFSEVK